MRVWRNWLAYANPKSVNCASSTICTRFTNVWIPARRNSLPIPHICIQRMKTSVNPARTRIAKKSWCWVADRTVSVRGLSLTTAAFTPRWRCAKMVMKPLWSTVTRKPSPPTTTPLTVCTSNRLRWKTCWKSCASRSRRALSFSTAARPR